MITNHSFFHVLLCGVCCLSLTLGCSNKPQIPSSELVWESTFDSQCCDSYEVERRFTADSIELRLFYNSIIKASQNGRPYKELGIDYKNWGLEMGINGSAKGGWYIDKENQYYCFAEPLFRNRVLCFFCSEETIIERRLYGIKLNQFKVGEKEYHVSYHY